MTQSKTNTRLGTVIRALATTLKASWSMGPVPCWTEYLRSNSGR